MGRTAIVWVAEGTWPACVDAARNWVPPDDDIVRVEREVVAATADAILLICARDGDRSRLGPRSLGPATRFVVDHVPCPVLLVWPGEAPDLESIPPPPPPGAEPPPPPPHERH
jgi:hypothetical protein